MKPCHLQTGFLSSICSSGTTPTPHQDSFSGVLTIFLSLCGRCLVTRSPIAPPFHHPEGPAFSLFCPVQLLASLTQCLTVDPLSTSLWRQLYPKHLSQSRRVAVGSPNLHREAL